MNIYLSTARFICSVTYFLGRLGHGAVQLVKPRSEMLSCEPPLERLGNGLVMTLEGQQALCQLLQGREIVGRQGLSLEDREIDFDLIKPTGVNGPMNECQVGILGPQPSGCPGAPMRRAVVDDPESPASLTVGPLSHHLMHETIKGRLSTFGFAATEEFGTVDVQGGQIGPGPESLVFVLNFHRLIGLPG